MEAPVVLRARAVEPPAASVEEHEASREVAGGALELAQEPVAEVVEHEQPPLAAGGVEDRGREAERGLDGPLDDGGLDVEVEGGQVDLAPVEDDGILEVVAPGLVLERGLGHGLRFSVAIVHADQFLPLRVEHADLVVDPLAGAEEEIFLS